MNFLLSVFGFTSASLLISWAISTGGGQSAIFLNAPSLAIVLGCTVAAVVISYDVKSFMSAISSMFRCFGATNHSKKKLKEASEFFISIAKDIRTNKLVGLRDQAPKSLMKDPLFQKGMDLLESKLKPDQIEEILKNMNEANSHFYTIDAGVLNKMGSYAPSFGVVGTIIGLMAMLDNMNGDMTAMGKGLAIAFVTTFYGILLSQLVFRPTASALHMLEEGEFYRGGLLIEAFVNLSKKASNIEIEERLAVLTDPRKINKPQGEVA